MTNVDIWNKVRNVPAEAKKAINGGRMNGKTDINPVWRLKILTDTFGPCGVGWYYDIIEERLEKGGNDEVAAFVRINLYYKQGGEWSKAIPGTGGSSFVAKEKNGPYTSDECFKMALTDAISVSCKALGVGADVYWDKDPSKYDAKVGNDAPPKTGPKPDPKPIDDKAHVAGRIFKLMYPDAKDMTKEGRGTPNGFTFEVYSTELSAYNKLDKNVKSLNELNVDQLKDMEQKMKAGK